MLCRYWQSWPSKVWLLCAAVQHISFVSYRSVFVHEIGVTSWLTLWRRWLHICRLFILKVEYGFVHRGDDKLWDTLFWSSFPWPSLGRATFYLIKPPSHRIVWSHDCWRFGQVTTSLQVFLRPAIAITHYDCLYDWSYNWWCDSID